MRGARQICQCAGTWLQRQGSFRTHCTLRQSGPKRQVRCPIHVRRPRRCHPNRTVETVQRVVKAPDLVRPVPNPSRPPCIQRRCPQQRSKATSASRNLPDRKCANPWAAGACCVGIAGFIATSVRGNRRHPVPIGVAFDRTNPRYNATAAVFASSTCKTHAWRH